MQSILVDLLVYRFYSIYIICNILNYKFPLISFRKKYHCSQQVLLTWILYCKNRVLQIIKTPVFCYNFKWNFHHLRPIKTLEIAP